MMWIWAPILVLLLLAGLSALFFLRPSRPSSVGIEDLARLAPRGTIVPGHKTKRPDAPEVEKHDTIFVLPDISHYTRFMTGNEFAFAHAQYIVFALINAMIERATKTLEISKLEGDAALFYVDADRHAPQVIGETVMGIFSAFFTEQERLMRSNLCPCRACKSIADLDLKIFVHRGDASRFKFKGSIDHFGTDVIILHRMMKNTVESSRYVMVTESARDAVELPELDTPYTLSQEVAHVGTIQAAIHPLSDAHKESLIESEDPEAPMGVAESASKLLANVRSLISAAKALKGNRPAELPR